MKIAFFEMPKWEQEYISEKLKKHTVKFFEGALDDKKLKLISDFDVISVFIFSKVGLKILEKLPKLKLVSTRSTGFDHIDVEECKRRGIAVMNVPFYGENTVAEHAFALLLSISRNIHKSYVKTLNDDFSIDDLMGFDLKGKTIGIVGGGNIGMNAVRMARGFQMNVLVYDIVKRKELEKELGFKYASMDELLGKSDIVSLHVPYNKFTHHLINRKTLAMMKKGAVLINTSRGGVVDTDALFEALDKKKLGGAGLDVIEGEHLIKDERALLYGEANAEKWREIVRAHKIFRMDNVVFTTHNAFNSKEALIRILDTTIENINSVGKK